MLTATGCVSSQSSADRALALYKGQPIEAVIARWGTPVRSTPNEYGTIFTWNGVKQLITSQDVRTVGVIGNQRFAATTSAPSEITLSCTMYVQSDQRGRVIGFEGDGANGACASMLDRLN
jgi:hypothetical protein